MREMKFKNIHEMDIGLTSDRGAFPMITRVVEVWKEEGFLAALKKRHSKRIPNHVFIFVRRENGLLQACEMTARGIRCNSIKDKYFTGKRWKPEIIEVRRFPEYSNYEVRKKANERLLHHYSMSVTGAQEIEYDWAALLAFLDLAKESTTRRICSGLVVWETQFDGVKWDEKNPDSNTPYDIQKEGNSYTVADLK